MANPRKRGAGATGWEGPGPAPGSPAPELPKPAKAVYPQNPVSLGILRLKLTCLPGSLTSQFLRRSSPPCPSILPPNPFGFLYFQHHVLGPSLFRHEIACNEHRDGSNFHRENDLRQASWRKSRVYRGCGHASESSEASWERRSDPRR